ncbi:SWIM-type domain-containing protein [Chitinophaga sp. 180180018-2]|nr:SWIM-type domain-containing protein [Chitinophaga sp. 212800010-3]
MKPTIFVGPDMALPDNDQWQNRFNIKSESSNRLYVISQNKKGRHWGCSCPGWRVHRTCKHLSALGLPGNCTPHEVNLINE